MQLTYWLDDLGNPESPQNAWAVGLTASIVITGQLRVYGFTVSSTLAGTQFAQWFDASSLPADAAVPISFASVPTNSSVGVFFGDMGRVFHRGLVVCNSTTAGSKTIGAANCLFDVQYDLLVG